MTLPEKDLNEKDREWLFCLCSWQKEKEELALRDLRCEGENFLRDLRYEGENLNLGNEESFILEDAKAFF